MTDSRVEHVTCLGCGCGCDDIAVTIREGRIIETTPPCPVSKAWFGDGSVPWEVLYDGNRVPVDAALAEAAAILLRARGRLLVHIGGDLSTQAQRKAVMLADLLGATVDTATSSTAAGGILAAQRRGRATATLGEVRNRGDVLLFWGTDPAKRYPRFHSRYAPDPSGTQVPNGRTDRFVIGVGIGSDKAPANADVSLALEPAEEIAALSLMRAAVVGEFPGTPSAPFKAALDLVPLLTRARYAVLIHDAEPSEQPRDPLRVEALIALTQAVNGPTRAALVSLRAGGNRSGAESVLTWQTGFPFAVDHSRGYPRYTPEGRGLDRLERGGFSAVLLVGTSVMDSGATVALGGIDTVVIGPGASRAGFATRIAIDTGVAGIHETGTGYRMDDVPLPLRPPLPAQRSTVETLDALSGAIHRARKAAS